MNLKQIAMDVLDEYENDQVPEGVQKTENADGTVDLTFSFTLDPKVVAKKAKAMAKGLKRDDMTDDLGVDTDTDGDDAEEVFSDDVGDDAIIIKKAKFDENEGEGSEKEDDDEDPFNGVNTEDSADESTVFMDALDSIEGVDVEDARQNSRHSKTPLENCRAKDPRFCPYHGEKAWTKHLEDAISNVSGAKVEVKNDNGKYTAKVTVPTGMSHEAFNAIDSILNTNGVEHAATGFRDEAPLGNGDFFEAAQFHFAKDTFDRTARLNEWVDDYMAEVTNDPNAEFDMDDLSELLEAQEDIDEFEAKMNKNDANDRKTYNDMVDAAEQKYHSLMAQQYFKDVKDDKQAADKGYEIAKAYTDTFDKAHTQKDDVDRAKQAIFGGRGVFPNGFAKAHPFAEAYNKASQGIFHWAATDYEKAAIELAAASDMKAKRAALAAMDYAKENFENRVPGYEAAQKKFMQDFYDWASKDAKYSGNVGAAFPNGRPQ